MADIIRELKDWNQGHWAEYGVRDALIDRAIAVIESADRMAEAEASLSRAVFHLHKAAFNRCAADWNRACDAVAAYNERRGG